MIAKGSLAPRYSLRVMESRHLLHYMHLYLLLVVVILNPLGCLDGGQFLAGALAH